MTESGYRHSCPAPSLLGGGAECPIPTPCGRHCRILLEQTDLTTAEADALASQPCGHDHIQGGTR